MSVLVSCQTIALPYGRPVRRFHTTVVSRWLVMPSAARSAMPRWLTFQHGLNDRAGPFPDLHRVVLHPAGTGQHLGVLELMAGDLGARVIEDQEAGTRGALIHRPDEIGHAVLPRFPARFAAMFLHDPDIGG